MKKKRQFPVGTAKENVLLICPIKNEKGTYKFKKVIVHKDKVKEAIKILTGK